MTEHSPQAVAAYPHFTDMQTGADTRAVTLAERTAFDAGMAVTYATTREALVALMLETEFIAWDGSPKGDYSAATTKEAAVLADAILTYGALRDERIVKAEAFDEAATLANLREGVVPLIRRAAELRAEAGA